MPTNSSLTVLVIDDSDVARAKMELLLEDAGMRVLSLPSPIGATRAILANHVDVVVIDVLMPGRSGLDLLVTLRRDPRWCDIPLVVITGSDQVLEDDCQSYLGSHHGVRGPDGVLGKPVDRDTLLTVLRHLRRPGASVRENPGA